jgi:hypothetical protein
MAKLRRLLRHRGWVARGGDCRGHTHHVLHQGPRHVHVQGVVEGGDVLLTPRAGLRREGRSGKPRFIGA